MDLRHSNPPVREALEDALAAVAEPTRRLVVDLLARGPRSAGALAAAARTSPQAMSRHLRVLRRCGLLAENHDPTDSRRRIYSLRPEGLTEIKGWLEEIDAFWSDQLMAFKKHMEGR